MKINETEIIELMSSEKTREKGVRSMMDAYQSRLYWHIRRLIVDHDLAQDVLQDTFIKAYQNFHQFKQDSQLYTWLYRIAYNIFYDYIRSRKETNDLDAREVDATSSVEQDNLGQKMDVYQSLKTLKEIERTCITLFYMEDVSIEKIAGITGCPVGTEKSHLARGKEKLANYLNKNGYERN